MRYDIVVVGSGPAGAALAYWLAHSGLRTVMIEGSRLDRPRIGESLAPAVQPLLRELSAWEAFQATEPLRSYGTQSAWGLPHPESHSHIMSPYGCGWHVDRLRFDRMLAEHAVAAGAELWLGARVVQLAGGLGGRWTVTVERESSEALQLDAAFVVDASGRSAWAGRRLGGRREVVDRLGGAVAHVRCPDAYRQCYTSVESMPWGWWYAAPTAADRMAVVLMTDSDFIKPMRAGTRGGWLKALKETTITKGRVQLDGQDGDTLLWGPHVGSAASQRLRRLDFSSRWLAVGDASLAVDPISGSGVVRALRSAREVSRVVLDCLAGDTAAILRRYNAEEAAWAEYLQERAAYYGLESRWTKSPFWSKRVAAIEETNSLLAPFGIATV